jgi:hypothetical protein
MLSTPPPVAVLSSLAPPNHLVCVVVHVVCGARSLGAWGQAKQRVRSIRKDAVDALKDAKGEWLVHWSVFVLQAWP